MKKMKVKKKKRKRRYLNNFFDCFLIDIFSCLHIQKISIIWFSLGFFVRIYLYLYIYIHGGVYTYTHFSLLSDIYNDI